MFQRLDREIKNLIKEAIEISYWSRGAVSYHSVYELTPVERDEWKEWLKNRLDNEAQKPNPSY